ncbi:hypothetical protein [Marinobacter sp. F3R08]|uniref:hypothetical protein n=1 Tax=Marinobacter sp. F3R08 TaxID=2841559 RepID=UPI001C08A02B|nr:hypothetical protein [Marinobacter sp. F3R08]MBU2952315.1 hypothetical protein [Marinobacter sp. F3R08]
MRFMKPGMASFTPVLAIGLLSGCASSGITKENPDHSRAWNLTHSVAMTDLDDSTVPSDQIPSGLRSTLDMAIDVSYFVNSATLGMSLGDAFGLGLVGALLNSKKSHGERSTMVAWIPADDVDSRESAHLWLGDAVKDATLQAMDTLGIEGEPEFHNELTESFWHGTFTETLITGVSVDGTECGMYMKLYPETVSELRTIPDFIAPNIQGYQVIADDEYTYPVLAPWCASEKLDQYIEFAGEISKNLPETVFFYVPQVESDEQTVPPIVFDHGKALLFLVAED